jgi:uncharacterized protein YndB with AHSA1/START domain
MAMEDRIEQEITIKASLDRVWELVTRPGWWIPGTDAGPATGAGTVEVVESDKHGRFSIEVVSVEPRAYAAFRWASEFRGAVPAAGNSTLVEFFVRPGRDDVSVTVVESGFSELDLPGAARESAWKDNTSGWENELAVLRTWAERPSAS